ncbi:MAG: radical SAM protein, partial [Candidatus Hydrogenedentes bacterium]|nr:radical SAM protein [Candidatus Hydrogenedentota bacterium]
VGKKGAFEKIIAAIERMVELKIPFRFNCTMSKPVVPLLPEIAKKAVLYGANAVNYIAFNPFGDQQTGMRNADNVPRYSDIKPKLTEAMDILEDAGIEVNVRYLPLCMGEERHRKNFYNFQQLPYDHHEWDYQSWIWTMMQPQMMKEGPLVPPVKLGVGTSKIYRGQAHKARDLYAQHPVIGRVVLKTQHAVATVQQAVRGKETMLREEAVYRAAVDCKYGYDAACEKCAARRICDGFHGDYAEFYGTSEAQPITNIQPVNDPLYYISQQEKIVEEEDASWAL